MGRQATFIYDKNIQKTGKFKSEFNDRYLYNLEYITSHMTSLCGDFLWVDLTTFLNENFYRDHNQTEFKIAHE